MKLDVDLTVSTFIDQIKASGITDINSTEFKEALDRKIMGEVYAQIDAGTFLGKLFDIGIKNGSIEPHFVESEYHVANEGYVNGIGVNNTIMNSVLSDYISDNQYLNGKVSIVTSKLNNDSELEKQRIRSEIVEIVKTGRPVLMGGSGYTDSNKNGIQDSDESGFGHVVVAYEYDELNDVLNRSNNNHSTFDEQHCSVKVLFIFLFYKYMFTLNDSKKNYVRIRKDMIVENI